MAHEIDRSNATTTSGEVDPQAVKPLGKVPGLVLIFANEKPRQRVFRLDGGGIELGRLELVEDDKLDSMISRRHVRVTFAGEQFQVSDLGSRNGTFVCANRISESISTPVGSTVRVGGALFLLTANVLPFMQHGVVLRDGIVVGPSLGKSLESVALTQQMGGFGTLLLSGETGSGKEIAAKAYHRAGPNPDGPFVAVNCATVPKELAESLLFGARRGAFSGATDAKGYVQAADGGTLFLDEIAELTLEVQSKLLRVLETREVLRLGATQSEPVNVRVCAATWRDLRQEVSAKRFREDLYFRVGQPEVRLAPLRERREEIPWHIAQTLDAVRGERLIGPTVTLVEACALRFWPGNVRELRAEIRRAGALARAKKESLLSVEELDPTAGCPLLDANEVSHSFVSNTSNTIQGYAAEPSANAGFQPSESLTEVVKNAERQALLKALEESRGNRSIAARLLGVSRSTLYARLRDHDLL